MAAGPLAGLRVLECGDFVAAPYAAALLGHLGADVLKVEPPEGDSNRRRGPEAGTDGQAISALHLFVDRTKRSIVIDLDTAEGRAELSGLARAADVVIASGPCSRMLARGLTYDSLGEENPALVVTTITPLGLQAGRDVPMREICDLARGGWLFLSPGALEDPRLPPLKPYGQQAYFSAGVNAAIATLGALAARDATGLGQQVDVSVQAIIVSQLENTVPHYTYDGVVPSRLGNRLLGPWGIVHLADGLLFLVCVTEDEWQRFLTYIEHPDWADSPLFADRLSRGENNDAVLALIEDTLGARTVHETYVELQARRVPCSPVNTIADLLANEHLRARDYFVDLDHPIAGRLTFPGAPWKLSATPWQAGRRAPLLQEGGSRQWAVGSREGTDDERTDSQGSNTTTAYSRLPTAPLHGIRVVDFTWVIAGPMAAMQLAHLGADVIKVESETRLDTGRAAIPPFWKGERGPNTGGFFNQYSQGKRSLRLNLKQPDGMALAYELIRCADVVIDNFGAGVMDRLGLGYDQLRNVNPSIVQISLSGLGQTGPCAGHVAYGPVQLPMIGLSGLTGYPGGGPREVAISYIDYNAGLHATCALLAALRHRARTGEGQYIDMSQWEAAVPLVAEGLLAYQMTGKQPERMGDRDEFEAPQGVFACAGEDSWLAVSCWSDAEWKALAGAIGREDLARREELGNAAGRKAHEEEIEAAIAGWTATRSRDDAANTLLAAGVPAAPVYTAVDVLAEPELAARDFWVELPHPECTGARHAGIPWRFSGTPLRVRRAAPCLGQHTDEILREILGKGDDDIAALREAGALS